MDKGWSEKVRSVAEREYIRPAVRGGCEVTIRVGDIHQMLRKEGFPTGHISQICSALESEKFWKRQGLEPRTPKGQARRLDTSYVFRVKEGAQPRTEETRPDPLLELVGVLKGAIREGADAFVREIRRDKSPG